MGCGLVLLAVFGFLAWAVSEGEKIEKQEAANPTCISDYTKCSDNEDVVKRHESKQGISLAIECESEAKRIAKYGRPEFSWLPFSSYYSGHSYIDNGVAILIDKNAKFKNGFNATMNSVATCFYDLKSDFATIKLDEEE